MCKNVFIYSADDETVFNNIEQDVEILIILCADDRIKKIENLPISLKKVVVCYGKIYYSNFHPTILSEKTVKIPFNCEFTVVFIRETSCRFLSSVELILGKSGSVELIPGKSEYLTQIFRQHKIESFEFYIGNFKQKINDVYYKVTDKGYSINFNYLSMFKLKK